MRVMGLLTGLAAVVLAACGGGSSPTTPTGTAATATTTTATAAATSSPAPATATGSPAATPTPTTTVTAPTGNEDITDNGYRVFLAKLDASLRAGDIEFVIGRFATTPYTCKEEDVNPQGLGGPACDRVGQQFDGILSSSWRSHGALTDATGVAAYLRRIKTDNLPAKSDEFGAGGLALYATGAGGTTVITGIQACPANFNCPSGQLRYALVLTWSFNGTRWVTGHIMSAFVLAEDFLTPTTEGRNRVGGIWTRYGQQPELPAAVAGAIQAAVRVFTEAKGQPNCVAGQPCIEAFDVGDSVDEGILRLSYSAPRDLGSAVLYMARDQSGAWQFWFGAQNVTHRLTDLPGTLMVCADGDGLNLRAAPNTGAQSLGLAKDGDTFDARGFLLTEFGDTSLKAGAGWYRIVTITRDAAGLPKTGEAYIYSRFTSDTRRGTCETRNSLER